MEIFLFGVLPGVTFGRIYMIISSFKTLALFIRHQLKIYGFQVLKFGMLNSFIIFLVPQASAIILNTPILQSSGDDVFAGSTTLQVFALLKVLTGLLFRKL